MHHVSHYASRMDDKGGVYLCGWERNAEGDYVGWLKKRPRVRVETMTLSEMVEYLLDEVMTATRDAEASLEFDPPLPGTESKQELFTDDLVDLGAGSHFRFGQVDKLFEGGVCSRCHSAIGSRTDVPITVSDIWPGDTSFSWDPRIGAKLWIVSQRFLSLLTVREKSAFSLREVIMPARKRKPFFELVPKKIVPEVGVRGWKPSGGWYCRKCSNWTCSYGELEIATPIVSRRDLPTPCPPLFFVGDQNSFNPCVSKKRWAGMRDDAATFGISASPVAVVNGRRAVARPKLPEYQVVLRRSKRAWR